MTQAQIFSIVVTFFITLGLGFAFLGAKMMSIIILAALLVFCVGMFIRMIWQICGELATK